MSAISRSTISIRVSGKNIDPNKVSQLLGCLPTLAAMAGDVITKPDGKTRVVKNGFWHLKYGESDAIELEEKIDNLLGKLTNDLIAWETITRDYRVDIFCGLFCDNWNEGFWLTPKLLRKLGERNIEIGFDIYSPTYSWYQDADEE